MSEHLTPTFTDRGFKIMPSVECQHGGRRQGEVRVQESSAASGPHIWITVTDTHARENATGHLPLAEAVKLRDQLTYLIDNHYQQRKAALEAERITDGVTLACTSCGREVVLPPSLLLMGYVSVKPLTGWEAPPLLCPDCKPKQTP